MNLFARRQLRRMPSSVSDHFRTVGFTLEREEIASLAQRALDGGTTIAAPSGDYRVWTPGAGAELWLAMRRLPGGGHELAGMHPHFAGDARTEAIVEGVEPNPDYALEGEIYAWASRGAGEHDLYPFSASVADFDAALSGRDLPFRASLALVGFAYDVRWWPSEDAYLASVGDEPAGFVPTSLVPTGLFGNNTGRARSRGVVTGRIRASETRFNPATERPFRVLRLATYGGEIDVVATPDLVAGDPPIDGVARASCWLSARIA